MRSMVEGVRTRQPGKTFLEQRFWPDRVRPLHPASRGPPHRGGSCDFKAPCRAVGLFAYPRNTPPVAFATCCTSAFEKASISGSVSVASIGCSVTVIASDF